MEMDAQRLLKSCQHERDNAMQQLRTLARSVAEGRAQIDYLSRGHADILQTVVKYIPLERQLQTLQCHH